MSENEICQACGQEIKPKLERGIHNWKNLFRKPTLNDWITLFMIAMVLVAAWAYNYDTKTCRQTLNNLGNICLEYNYAISNPNHTVTYQIPNLSGVIIINQSALKNETDTNGTG